MTSASSPSFLRMLEDCSNNFYKDEGGKSNFLTRVEDSDQSILNLLKSEYETYTLSPSEPTVTISFRLEKVSRRKDGQRFKLHVAPDLANMTPEAHKAVAEAAGSPAAAAQGVFTTAVVVMSKRRTGERFVSRPRPPRSVDADSTLGGGGIGSMGTLFAGAGADGLSSVPAQLHSLQSSVDSLISFLHKLDARQSAMEAALYSIVPRAPGASVGLPPTSVGPHSAGGGGGGSLWGSGNHARMHSGFEGFPSVPGMAQFSALPGPPGSGGLQGVSLGGLPGGNMGGLPQASTQQRNAPGGAGAGIKRIRSKDLQFNFGEPSSATPVAGGGGPGAAGDGESTMPPPLPGQSLGGMGAGGVHRMTSLDHMFSSMTANSAMAVDERAAVEALAGASSSSGGAAGGGAGGGRGQAQQPSSKRTRR